MKLTKEEQDKLNKQLFDAIERNNLNAVKAAVVAGADVNVKNKYGQTPLIESTNHFVDTEITRFLLEHGANPNAQNEDGNTALHYYFSIHKTSKVKLLLDYNADIYIKNKNERTPFAKALYTRYSVYLGHSTYLHGHSTAGIYVLHGYIPTAEDFKGMKDISRKEEIFEYYQELSKLSEKEKQARMEQIFLDGQLFEAIKKNDLAVVKEAVAAGADVNARDEDGWTPLIESTNHFVDTEITRFLLEHGADPNAQDEDGNIALHFYFSLEDIPKVKLLLEHNADMYIKNNNAYTPFAETISWDRDDMAIAELYVLNGYIPTKEDFKRIQDEDKKAEIKTYFKEFAEEMQHHKAKLNEAMETNQEVPFCDDELMEF